MAMDIKPSMSQGPTVVPQDPVVSDPALDKKSTEQEVNATAGNTQTDSNTVNAMKQAGTETKGSMATSGKFLQQELANQLEKKNEERSAVLLKSPKFQEDGKGGGPVSKFGNNLKSGSGAPAQQGGTATATKYAAPPDAGL